MIRIIVNDASCLIDLRKAQLVESLLSLPYEFIVPLPIARDELLDFSPYEWTKMEAMGLRTFDLSGDQLVEVINVKRQHQGLTVNDCFALITSEIHENSVLLTGDGLLKKVAKKRSVNAHGVLWAYDEILQHNVSNVGSLRFALETWRNDPSVFLPKHLIDERLKKLLS